MGSRMLECLALVLEEETSYKQTPGRPYIRKVRRNGGKVVATAAYDDLTGNLVWSDRTRSDIPAKPDGCAYDDDPDDTGGRTCMGILQREYDAWRRARGLGRQDVWRIADREIDDIFDAQYWQPLSCAGMPDGVDYFMVDFGFACGIGKAAEKLQRALGVKVDRHVGLGTIDALHRATPSSVIDVLSADRLAYYKACRTWWKHGAGWTTRNRRVTARALEMCVHPEDRPPVVAAIEPATPTPSPTAARDSGATTSGGAGGLSTLAGSVGGGVLLLSQVNAATRETRESGLGDLVMTLAASWQFWAAVACSAALLVAYREDVKRRLGWS